MTVYLKHGWCFVQLNKGMMICIGQKSEVDNSTDSKIAEMVFEAIAVSKYKEITKSPKLLN